MVGQYIPGRLLRLVLSTSALSAAAMLVAAGCEVWIARVLGVDGYGAFASGLALATVIGAAIGLGLPQLALKELRNGDSPLLHTGLRSPYASAKVTFLHGFSLIAVSSAMMALVQDKQWQPSIVVFFLASTIMAKIGLRRVLTGDGAPREGLIVDELLPIFLLASFVAITVASDWGAGATELLMLFGAANLASVAVSYFRDHQRRLRLSSPAIRMSELPIFYRRSAHFVPFVFSFIAAKKVDIFILGQLAGVAATGQYSAAAKLVAPGLAVAAAINLLSTPELANAFNARSKKALGRALRQGAIYSFLVAAPYYLLLVVFARSSLSLIFGESYIGAWPVLVVLAFGALLTVATGPLVTVFSVTGMSTKLARITTFYLVILVGLVLALTLAFGPLGAAVASCLAGATYRWRLSAAIKEEIRNWPDESVKT